MTKDIIISGPPASGKTWIAIAIAGTHKKVIQINAPELKKRLNKKYIDNLTDEYTLMIIDGCSANDIIELDLTLGIFPSIDHFTGKMNGPDKLPIVYLTQEHVTKSSLGHDRFHIIHCRNAHF